MVGKRNAECCTGSTRCVGSGSGIVEFFGKQRALAFGLEIQILDWFLAATVWSSRIPAHGLGRAKRLHIHKRQHLARLDGTSLMIDRIDRAELGPSSIQSIPDLRGKPHFPIASHIIRRLTPSHNLQQRDYTNVKYSCIYGDCIHPHIRVSI